jgi:hypothetical protein
MTAPTHHDHDRPLTLLPASLLRYRVSGLVPRRNPDLASRFRRLARALRAKGRRVVLYRVG